VSVALGSDAGVSVAENALHHSHRNARPKKQRPGAIGRTTGFGHSLRRAFLWTCRVGQYQKALKAEAASVTSILRGDTSAQEAARKHGLTVAEVEEWKEKFLFGVRTLLGHRQGTKRSSSRNNSAG
jgi:hypothetical protein